jgi:hypothetical protein
LCRISIAFVDCVVTTTHPELDRGVDPPHNYMLEVKMDALGCEALKALPAELDTVCLQEESVDVTH